MSSLDAVRPGGLDWISNLRRAQGSFELTKVFGHFGPPGHLLPWALRVFQSQYFGVQSLARKGDVSFGGRRAGCFAAPWIISSIANQWQPAMGGLGAYLMFAARFKA